MFYAYFEFERAFNIICIKYSSNVVSRGLDKKIQHSFLLSNRLVARNFIIKMDK
jgi:hypothetical protein